MAVYKCESRRLINAVLSSKKKKRQCKCANSSRLWSDTGQRCRSQKVSTERHGSLWRGDNAKQVVSRKAPESGGWKILIWHEGIAFRSATRRDTPGTHWFLRSDSCFCCCCSEDGTRTDYYTWFKNTTPKRNILVPRSIRKFRFDLISNLELKIAMSTFSENYLNEPYLPAH